MDPDVRLEELTLQFIPKVLTSAWGFEQNGQLRRLTPRCNQDARSTPRTRAAELNLPNGDGNVALAG